MKKENSDKDANEKFMREYAAAKYAYQFAVLQDLFSRNKKTIQELNDSPYLNPKIMS